MTPLLYRAATVAGLCVALTGASAPALAQEVPRIDVKEYVEDAQQRAAYVIDFADGHKEAGVPRVDPTLIAPRQFDSGESIPQPKAVDPIQLRQDLEDARNDLDRGRKGVEENLQKSPREGAAGLLQTIRYANNTCDYFPGNAGVRTEPYSRRNNTHRGFGTFYNGSIAGNPANASYFTEAQVTAGGPATSIETGDGSAFSTFGYGVSIQFDEFRAVRVTNNWAYNGNLRAGSNSLVGGILPVIGPIIGPFTGRSSSTATYNVSHVFFEGSRGSAIGLGNGNLGSMNGVGGAARDESDSGILRADYPLRSGTTYIAGLQLNTGVTYQTVLGANVSATSNFSNSDIIGNARYGVMRWQYTMRAGTVLGSC